MSDNSQIVDNPLELLSLFPQGVYVFSDRPAFRFEYEGQYARRVLNVFSLEGPEHLHPSLAAPLGNLMGALKLNGKLLQAGDFAVLNVKKLEKDVSFEEILQEFEPEKTIFWLDHWEDVHTEVRAYETGKMGRYEILRVHALPTVMQDAERKKECWTVLKRFFGMS